MSARQPGSDDVDPAELLARGVARLLTEIGYSSLTEFTLRSGRRADVAGIDGHGRIIIVEIKRSVADFRADRKWPDYLDYCDEFYFAVPARFPHELLPDEAGLIVADRFGAELLRPSAAGSARLHPSRRREVLLRFAHAAAGRLQRLSDPDSFL
ncbi:MAG TPA: MmcB family DNA repair protein [Alphaproteobacteria bacterium]|nr:MmcB family DNA repair protein [Alphaproteobacteria bacterium]